MTTRLLIKEREELRVTLEGLRDTYSKGELPPEKEEEFDNLIKQVQSKDADITKAREREEKLKRIEEHEYTYKQQTDIPFSMKEGDEKESKKEEVSIRKGFTDYLLNKEHTDEFSMFIKKAADVTAMVSIDAAGGYLLVPEIILNELITNIRETSTLKNRMRNFTVNIGQSVTANTAFGTFKEAPKWTPEVPDDFDDPEKIWPFGRMTVGPPNKLTKLILIPEDLLLVPGGSGVESHWLEEMRAIFQQTEEYAYVNGSGFQEPLGVRQVTAAGIPSARDLTAPILDKADFGIPGSSGATNPVYDALIDMRGKLRGSYRQGATWLMHEDLTRDIAKVKDADGNYIWKMGQYASGGAPVVDSIWGIPVTESIYMPPGNANDSGTTTARALMLINLKYYWTVTANVFQTRRYNEIFAKHDAIGYRGRMFGDGKFTMPDAAVGMSIKLT